MFKLNTTKVLMVPARIEPRSDLPAIQSRRSLQRAKAPARPLKTKQDFGVTGFHFLRKER